MNTGGGDPEILKREVPHRYVLDTSSEAHRTLGLMLADTLSQATHKPGFMRTLMWHMDNHTCPEFTYAEQRRLDRVWRKLRRKRIFLSMEGKRQLIYWERSQC